jgi:hypothetical protein
MSSFGPFKGKVNVLVLHRSSPGTNNDCKTQNVLACSSLDLIQQNGYFPDGYQIVKTVCATEQSRYKTENSPATHEVWKYAMEHSEDVFVVFTSDFLRIGGNSYNISICIETALKLAPNCQFASAAQFGISWKEISKLIDSHWSEKQDNRSQALRAMKSSSELEHYSESATVRETIHQEARRIGQSVKGNLVGFDSQEFDKDRQLQLGLNVHAAVAEGKNVSENEFEVSVIINQFHRDNSLESALRDLLSLPFTKPGKCFVIWYFRSSPTTRIAVTMFLNLLPMDQLIHVTAAMKVLSIDTPRCILYDEGLKRDGRACGMKMNGMKGMNGMIRMISLALSGRISHVLLKSCERIPSKFMPILVAVCKDRNVQIISVRDFGKDLVAIAEIELHRRMKNKEISNEMNAAIKSIKELWDDPQRSKVSDSLERLTKIAKGWERRLSLSARA